MRLSYWAYQAGGVYCVLGSCCRNTSASTASTSCAVYESAVVAIVEGKEEDSRRSRSFVSKMRALALCCVEFSGELVLEVTCKLGSPSFNLPGPSFKRHNPLGYEYSKTSRRTRDKGGDPFVVASGRSPLCRKKCSACIMRS